MATTPYNIIAGPADVYVAAVGTGFTVVNAAPSGSWTYIGKTDGGVSVHHSQDIQLIDADQSTGPVKAIRTKEGLEVSTNLMDLTLEKFAILMNNVTVTSNAGPPATKEITLWQGFDVAQFALICRGPSPYGNWNCQYQVPVVVVTGEPEVTYTREDKAVLAVKWTALEDPNAGSNAQRFGKLIAQSA